MGLITLRMFICIIQRRVPLPPICPCHLLPMIFPNNPGLCKSIEWRRKAAKPAGDVTSVWAASGTTGAFSRCGGRLPEAVLLQPL